MEIISLCLRLGLRLALVLALCAHLANLANRKTS